MKFNELSDMMQKSEPKPDTYEAGMALNQLLKIGTHAIKIHNMIDDAAEMESWVAKKIDLASNYVKSVHGYTAGSKAGTYDDDGMSEGTDTPATDKEIKMAKGIAFDKRNKDNMSKATSTIEKVKKGLSQQPDVADALKTANEDAGSLTDQQKQGLQAIYKKYGNYEGYGNGDSLPIGNMEQVIDPGSTLWADDKEYKELDAYMKKMGYDGFSDAQDKDEDFFDNAMKEMPISSAMQDDISKVLGNDYYWKSNLARAAKDYMSSSDESVSEDAGEGHMSKSQLYQTAKMAIELLDMIRKGDDLEGWVQTKLNLAADYLQAVYHYEDYQKLNPYREEIDGSLMQKHAGIIQKHLDEILERKCRAEDVDTKPGMMRILKKRVNEVEKEIAKENRKQTDETELEEGIKEWGKRLAMAGVIVAGLAGVNSINNAIDNSIPAVKAMNTALEMAQDSGNDELAKMIEKDLSDAKVRLSSGKDLSHVADMQDKYAKFMKTEGLAYESKLAINLKQRLK
jgi:hypothetical protein